jgi:mRNA interferase MazF
LEQGDLIEIDFNPSVGHVPAKLRPAVVVSGYGFNSRSNLVAVVPISSTDNGYPLHVEVETNKVSGFAFVEALRTLDVSQRSYKLLDCADDSAMKAIMTKYSRNARTVLGLSHTHNTK